jgi:hypothetical protein
MAMTLITTNTSSDAASSDFTTGIDSTYKLYVFKFIDVSSASDNVSFSFQANASGQSGYNETITSTYFQALHTEDDVYAQMEYVTSADQAEGTGYQWLITGLHNVADESCAGELYLFNPSNTTYVKHFYATMNNCGSNYYSINSFIAGYFNVTAAIDEVSFKMSSGNMDAVISMYGVG